MSAIGRTFGVYVLGSAGTSWNVDSLAQIAAYRGAVIRRTYTFPPGRAAGHEDLTEIDVVVEALGSAIATRTAIWIPFWLRDFGRESHMRRLSLTCERHGVDLLVGLWLLPCPVGGGMSELDTAIRREVKAVFELEAAALAGAYVDTLTEQVEAALVGANGPPRPPAEPIYYSTAEVADMLGKSADWVSRGLRRKAFAYADGSPVRPVCFGRNGRRFSVAMIRAIAWSAFRRGTVTWEQISELLPEVPRSAR